MSFLETLASERLRSWPIIEDVDKQAVVASMDEDLTGHRNRSLLELERRFAEFSGADYCLGFNGGTAAIHAALFACGVRAGDEVIVPAFSFSGTFMPILALGATPVFVDIEPDTFNINPGLIWPAITQLTKAIIPVHIHGLMADMDGVRIAAGTTISIVEDACQAHGASFGAEPAGTIGDAGCFSLNHTKILPGGEGGLLITNSSDIRTEANKFRIFGEDLTRIDPKVGRTYECQSMGLNYLLPGMSAALANSQLKRFEQYANRARLNGLMLDKVLGDSEFIAPQATPKGSRHTYHKYRLRIAPQIDRDELIKRLRMRGVPCGLWQVTPMPLYPLFSNRHAPEQYPETIKLLNESIIVGSEKYPLCAQDSEVAYYMAEVVKAEAKRLWRKGVK